MKKSAVRPLAAAILAALAFSVNAADPDPSWMVRLRAIDVAPNASSSVSGLDSNSQWAPELDFTYFFNKNVSTELILATTRHEITLNGTSLGKVSVLPPTITVQYHFTEMGLFQPYLGGGLNISWFYNDGLALPGPAATPLSVSDTSVGGALQGGFDYEIAKNWFFNADVKYIWMSTDVKLPNGDEVTKLHLNPWVFGVGFGYRF